MDGKKAKKNARPISTFAADDNAEPPRATSSNGRAHKLARRMLEPRRPALRDIAGFVALLIGAVASMATNLADPPSSEEATDENAVVTCTEEDDCADNEALPYCLESWELCVECREDEHCGPQERCFDYRCADSCTTHSDCEGDLICVDSLCRQCSEDADCGDPGQYCYIGAEFNACRPLCTTSAECSGPGYTEGDVCRGGRCQAIECESPQDCLVDRELCDSNTGLCTPISPNQ